jgi:hypothetical protein
VAIITGGGITAVNQLYWDELLIGRPSSLRIKRIQGLPRSAPPQRTERRHRPRRHGEFRSAMFSAGRQITAELQALIPGNDTGWEAIETAAAPGIGDLRLRVRSVAGGRELIAPAAQFLGFTNPLDPEALVGAARLDAEWYLPDPRLYDAVEQVETTGLATPGSGLVWPLTWPLDWGGASASGGQITAVNEGNFETPWVAEIAGPVVNPRIVNQTAGKSLSFVGTVAAGQTLTVNTDDYQILLDAAPRFDWLQVGSEWAGLAKGTNVIQFAASSGSGQMTLRWRSAWNG